MQITKPTFCNEFSCIAGSCPDTCCAGWQIMIDQNSLKKYRHCKGAFRNRLLNDIDWKEHSFRHYQKRCAFLNEDNLCDIYSEAGKDMLCDTCRKYPRHIEEFEGLRELSLSLSCPEAARIFLSHKEKITFRTVEKETPEETYYDFDYFLFTALMDTRDYLFSVIQDRSVPCALRRRKLLAAAMIFSSVWTGTNCFNGKRSAVVIKILLSEIPSRKNSTSGSLPKSLLLTCEKTYGKPSSSNGSSPLWLA